MKIQRISRIPGSEPVLLDLEKLFLLSDSMDSIDKTKFFEKNIFQYKLRFSIESDSKNSFSRSRSIGSDPGILEIL